MEQWENAIGAFILMAGVVTIVFIISRYTYLIKKVMVEKGLIDSYDSKKPKYLDIGGIIGGLGVGLIISTIYTTLDLSEDATDLLVWGTILICSSLGLIAVHFLRKKFDS